MIITLRMEGEKRPAKVPYEEADHVIVEGKCPCCSVEPFQVRGKGISRKDYDSYYAEAHCIACGKFVGTLRTKVDTLFGIEEDERVLNGPWRVY